MNSDLPSHETRIGDFLSDLETELKAEGIEDLGRRLIGLEIVERELVGIRNELELQVIRGSGVVEEYLRRGQEEAALPSIEAPDFILRRDNVELLVDLLWSEDDAIVLDRNSLVRLKNLIAASSKSEEVIVAWPNKELLSLSLGLDDIRNHIADLGDAESLPVEPDKLEPLSRVVRTVFERYRLIVARPSRTARAEDAEFDSGNIFRAKLDAAFSALADSLPRRRLRERSTAIKSLSNSDFEALVDLFEEAMTSEVDEMQLATRIEQRSRMIGD